MPLLVHLIVLTVFSQTSPLGSLALPSSMDIDEVQRLEQLSNELFALRRTRREEQREFQQQRDSLNTRIKQLRIAHRSGQEQWDALRKRHQRAQETLAQQQSVQQRYQEQLKVNAEQAMLQATLVQERIGDGIPFQRERRLEAVSQILRNLAAAEWPQRSQAIADFHRFVAGDLKLARSIESFNAPVILADRNIQAYQLRLGLLQQFLVAEDGSQVAQIGPGTEWRIVSANGDRRQILSAFEILQKRKPPEPVALPIVLTDGS